MNKFSKKPSLCLRKIKSAKDAPPALASQNAKQSNTKKVATYNRKKPSSRRWRKIKSAKVAPFPLHCHASYQVFDEQQSKNIHNYKEQTTFGGINIVPSQKEKPIFNHMQDGSRDSDSGNDEPVHDPIPRVNIDQKELFDRIENKIAKIEPLKLPPITNADIKTLQLEYDVFQDGRFYRANIAVKGGEICRRPDTPSLVPRAPKEPITEEFLKLKQIKANQLKAEEINKQLRQISARRERFEHRKAAIEEAKRANTLMAMRDARKQQALQNKARIDADKTKVRVSCCQLKVMTIVV